MARWIEQHLGVSDLEIKISLLILGFFASAGTLLIFYCYRILR
jgi:hypothetical protein